MTESSGNVFLDLGFPPDEAAVLQDRATIHIAILKMARGMSHTELRAKIGFEEQDCKELLEGDLDDFSTDDLLSSLHRLGERS